MKPSSIRRLLVVRPMMVRILGATGAARDPGLVVLPGGGEDDREALRLQLDAVWPFPIAAAESPAGLWSAGQMQTDADRARAKVGAAVGVVDTAFGLGTTCAAGMGAVGVGGHVVLFGRASVMLADHGRDQVWGRWMPHTVLVRGDAVGLWFTKGMRPRGHASIVVA